MVLTEIKPTISIQVGELVTPGWREAWNRLGARLGAEVFVPDFPDVEGFRSKIEEGYRAIYLPQEISSADKIPFLGEALGLKDAYCFKETFANEAKRFGWRYVYGSPKTPLLGLSVQEQQAHIRQVGGTGVTFNEELLLYFLLGGKVDIGTFTRVFSTKADDKDLTVSFTNIGIPLIAYGKGWPQDALPHIGARWSLPVQA